MGQDTKPMPTSDIPKRKQELFDANTRAGGLPTPARLRGEVAERAFVRATEGLKIPEPAKDVNLPVEKRKATRPVTRRDVRSRR